MVLATVSAVAQQTAPAPTLVPGSEVKLESVTSAKWVQGEPLKAFEPGKVYMFECWATWCGPCVAAIPHVNELHKKYHEKGLRVYGMNVWEDGLDKVENFVKGKGDGMSYPVAYTGKGSAFENEWLKPAGVTGIPRALIVKDGKLVLSTHPSKITDSLVEALIAGGDASKKAIDEIAGQETAMQKIMPLMRAFSQASRTGDVATMEKTLEEIEKTNPKYAQIAIMKIDILIAKKDFASATKALEELPDARQRTMASSMIANKISMEKDPAAYPVDFVKIIVKYQSDAATPQNPMGLVTTSILHWKAGDKEAALKAAKDAVTAAGEPGPRKMPVAAFEKFAKSVEDGTMPALTDFYQWLSAEMKAAQPAKPAVPAAPVKPAAE